MQHNPTEAQCFLQNGKMLTDKGLTQYYVGFMLIHSLPHKGMQNLLVSVLLK